MHTIRRKDREISPEEAETILATAEYGVLSTVSAEGQPYGVPLSFCILDGHIYFHCAMEGQKLDHLKHNNAVSFCVVGRTEVLPAKFSTKYESAIAFGSAEEVFEEEKQGALEALVRKYSPDHIESGAKYIDALTYKTRVFRIVIDHLSGKSRRQ